MVTVAILVSVFAGCSTVEEVDRHRQLTQSVHDNNYRKALELVNAEEFFPEERSALLRLLEKGTVNYCASNYYQSLKIFEEAKKLSNDLFTKSMTSAAVGIVDSNLNEFYGRKYEHSLIRFYESLSHYSLYYSGKYESREESSRGRTTIHVKEKNLVDEEKRFHFVAAKSVLKAWNALLNSYENENYGKAVYKSDLMEKIWGAFIHRESGSYDDRQIALGLYKQAKNILSRDYGIYPIFNRKHKKFRENFHKFSSSANTGKIRSQYMEETTYAKELYKFIDVEIEKLQSNKSSNLLILLKDGLVVEKKSKPYDFPIGASLFESTDGKETWKYCKDILKIGTSIRLSIPNINYKNTKNKFEARLLDLNGNIVAIIPIVLVLPVSDIAFYEIDREIFTETSKMIATTVAKYVAAIYTSYKLYKQIKDDKLGFIIASNLFIAEKSFIDKSSRPDLRQWLTLPSNIRIGSGYLDAGNYLLKIYSIDENSLAEVYRKEIKIGQTLTFIDINL
jgi:hypothetical protein